MSKVGIMGGTFNPIHIGHLLLAECARETYGLDKVLFVPTGHSYMKDAKKNTITMPTAKQRLEMTVLATRDNPFFEVSSIEVDREGNTYSFETLEQLKKQFPEDEFFFIFGADCLYTIETWREPGRIFAACEVIAAVRGDASLDQMQEKIMELKTKFDAQIYLMPFRNLEISSTDVRNRVNRGMGIRYLVPESVSAYIETRGFYQNETD